MGGTLEHEENAIINYIVASGTLCSWTIWCTCTQNWQVQADTSGANLIGWLLYFLISAPGNKKMCLQDTVQLLKQKNVFTRYCTAATMIASKEELITW